MLLKDIYDSCNAPGNRYIKEHMEGKKLSLNQAVKAKCAECMCGFLDGKVSCDIPDCPLFPWMSYRNKKSSITEEVMEDKNKKKRVLSKEHKEKMKKGKEDKKKEV